MYNYYKAVKEFHETFKCLINHKPCVLSNDQRLGRIRLISEELSELVTALDNNDIVEIADALGDLVYVTVGTYISHGFEADELCNLMIDIHHKEVPIIEGAGLGIPWEDKKDLVVSHYVRNLLMSLADYCTDCKSLEQVKDTLECIVVAEQLMAAALGLPLDRIFSEIHSSNMTKVGGRHEGGKYIKPETYRPVNLGWIKNYIEN